MLFFYKMALKSYTIDDTVNLYVHLYLYYRFMGGEMDNSTIDGSTVHLYLDETSKYLFSHSTFIPFKSCIIGCQNSCYCYCKVL